MIPTGNQKDLDIAEAIVRALDRNPDLDMGRLEVKVENGELNLARENVCIQGLRNPEK